MAKRKTTPRTPKEATASTRPPGVYVDFDEDDVQVAHFGFCPGDELSLTEVTDPRPGEVILGFGEGQWKVGRFCGYTRERGVWCWQVERLDGHRFYDASGTYYRVATITRNGVEEVPERPPRPIDLCRLKELRERAERLYAPEDESARFRVLREIYDLEHAAEIEAALWPEVIAV